MAHENGGWVTMDSLFTDWVQSFQQGGDMMLVELGLRLRV